MSRSSETIAHIGQRDGYSSQYRSIIVSLYPLRSVSSRTALGRYIEQSRPAFASSMMRRRGCIILIIWCWLSVVRARFVTREVCRCAHTSCGNELRYSRARRSERSLIPFNFHSALLGNYRDTYPYDYIIGISARELEGGYCIMRVAGAIREPICPDREIQQPP